ncbi:MAG: hypothetical protein LBJ78_04760 [Puniceicoccales bacterium]|nr:hypothetical protein [Puniceicoccales bacterium]
MLQYIMCYDLSCGNPFDHPDPELNTEPPTSPSNDGCTGQNKHPVTSAQSAPSGPNIAAARSSTQRTAAAASSEINQMGQEFKSGFAAFAAKVKNLNLFSATQWSAVGRSFKLLCNKIAHGTFDEVKSAAKSLGREIKALFRQKSTPESVRENVGNILHRAGEALDRAENPGDVGDALVNMLQRIGDVIANAGHDTANAARHHLG